MHRKNTEVAYRKIIRIMPRDPPFEKGNITTNLQLQRNKGLLELRKTSLWGPRTTTASNSRQFFEGKTAATIPGVFERARSSTGVQKPKPQFVSHPKHRSLFESRLSLENYTVGSEIGRGSFSVVKLGTHRVTAVQVALKIYEKRLLNDARENSVRKEIRILLKLDHPNIVKLYEVIEDSYHIVLVQEFLSGCSLGFMLRKKTTRRLGEIETKHILFSLISAIHYCHSLNITHHDIKLQNLLMTYSNNVKIIDFGFASEEHCVCYCGTPNYMAPELVKGLPSGPPCDIWACSVLLYTLLTGSHPFTALTAEGIFAKATSLEYTVPDYISLPVKSLLSKMFNPDPNKRISSSLILADPWLIPHNN